MLMWGKADCQQRDLGNQPQHSKTKTQKKTLQLLCDSRSAEQRLDRGYMSWKKAAARQGCEGESDAGRGSMGKTQFLKNILDRDENSDNLTVNNTVARTF